MLSQAVKTINRACQWRIGGLSVLQTRMWVSEQAALGPTPTHDSQPDLASVGPVVSVQALADLHWKIPCAKQQGWQCLVKWLMYLQLLQMLKTRCHPCFVSNKCVGEIQLLPLRGTLKEPGVNWLKKSFASWCHGSMLDCGRSRQQHTPLFRCWILSPAFG